MMTDAPLIQSITVQLDDGRWQYFSAADLAIARNYTEWKIWRLLEFVTSLAPRPDGGATVPTPANPSEDAPPAKACPNCTELRDQIAEMELELSAMSDGRTEAEMQAAYTQEQLVALTTERVEESQR